MMEFEKNRPDAVFAELAAATATFPDLRVGQLLDNALAEYKGTDADLFYMTDTHLANALQVYTARHGQKGNR